MQSSSDWKQKQMPARNVLQTCRRLQIIRLAIRTTLFHCNIEYSYSPIEPFFNPLAGPLSDAASDEDEDPDSQNEAETPRVSRNTGNEPAAQSHNANDEPGGMSHLRSFLVKKLRCFSLAWFAKPKYMQDWLYRYFATVIHPLIHNKNGGKILLAPPTFTESKPYAPPTLWIRSPEPVMSLSVHRFEPTLLFRPRVLLWLVHFFVDVLSCPKCGKPLEKNGALPPRRVVDLEDSFYIVAWAYYCRQGCQAHFHGWSQRLLNSLPPYVRLAFPAILSRKIGLSCNVVSTLHVGNQHKMGPSGVRSLLFEMHTRRFNVIQLQYLESIFERLQTRESANADFRNYFDASMKVPSIGNFSDIDGYGGFIPGERYLAAMLNKAIER